MTTPANVIEALAAVMDELPGIGKDSKADPRQGGYAYRGIEAITREAQPLFAKYGVVFVPRVMSYEIRDIIVNDKPWTDTVALVEYDVYGPGGATDKITVGPLLAIGRDNSDKGGNKVATQAFKYALIQTLCIADAKDDADQASHEADRRPRHGASRAPTVPDRVEEVSKLLQGSSATVEDVVAICHELAGDGAKVNDLTQPQYQHLVERLGELAKVS